MMLMICADVLLRNLPLLSELNGLQWANEVSESLLYLITLLCAPWILRKGQHVRVDIVLVALPRRLAWYCEWVADAVALTCCVFMMIYGASAARASLESGALSIKTLITPEWWALSVLPVIFALLVVELIFRMHRLYVGERGPRSDAVSVA